MTKPKDLLEDGVIPTSPPSKFPVTNVVRIDVNRLVESLERYESDRKGFFDQIPRLR